MGCSRAQGYIGLPTTTYLLSTALIGGRPQRETHQWVLFISARLCVWVCVQACNWHEPLINWFRDKVRRKWFRLLSIAFSNKQNCLVYLWGLYKLKKSLNNVNSLCITPSNELLSNLLFNDTKSLSGLTHFLAPIQRKDDVSCGGVHYTHTSH